MRELDRNAADIPLTPHAHDRRAGEAMPPGGGERADGEIARTGDEGDAAPRRVGIVGRGRMGRALSAALRRAGVEVDGPAGRGEVPAGDAILLCVPDAEIPAAAATLAGGAPLVGHTSGATGLGALGPALHAGAAAFGLHPLQTVTERDADAAAGGAAAGGPAQPPGGAAAGEPAHPFAGCGCAVAGSTPEALAAGEGLARRLGMTPFAIDDSCRPAYHAAASIASNFLVTLEAAAERVAAGAGLSAEEARALLAPLVRRSIENWAAHGPERALTGPVARGDHATVAAQRDAVAATAPELLGLFDALVERTAALAGAPPRESRAYRSRPAAEAAA